MDADVTRPISFNLMKLPHELILRIVEDVVEDDCEHFSERWIDLYRYRSTSHLLWETCRFMHMEVPKTFVRKFETLRVPGSVKQRASSIFSQISRGQKLTLHGKMLWSVAR